MIKYGYCKCGCGEKTNIINSNSKKRKLVRNEPYRFIKGHHKVTIIFGEKHYLWKGNKVSYTGLHHWIKKELGSPMKCQDCGTTKAKYYEWANISGKYKRDTNDFKRLCKKCHSSFDIKSRPRGVDVAKSKLTEKQVLHIRKTYKRRESKKLMEMFNVCRSTIICIVNRKTWRHI